MPILGIVLPLLSGNGPVCNKFVVAIFQENLCITTTKSALNHKLQQEEAKQPLDFAPTNAIYLYEPTSGL